MRVSLIFIRDERFFSRPSSKFLQMRAKKPYSGNKEHYVLADPPLGIMYLSSVLKKHGHEVSLYDQAHPLYSDEQFIESLREEKPEMVGISLLSNSSYPTAVQVSRKIKEAFPSMLIVCGGVFPTINADKIVETEKSIDVVGRGEGEEIILDLAAKKPLKDIKGITFRDENGEVVINEDRDLIEDLDALPFPDRDGIPDLHYVASLPLDVPAVVWDRPYTTILTSRGCPFACSFCNCPTFSRRKCRFRSAESILQELEEINGKYGAFCFIDDNFLLREKRVLEVCDKMTEKKYSFKWACEGRVDTRNDDIFKRMESVGCDLIMFGIESGSQKVLNSMQKKTKIEEIERSVKLAKKAGISVVHGFFIVGFPGETEEDVIKTFTFAEKLPLNSFAFNSLTAFRGTPLWNDVVERKLIDDKDWEKLFPIHKIDPTAVNSKALFKLRSRLVRRLILRKVLFHPIATLKIMFRFLKCMTFGDIIRLVTSSKKAPEKEKKTPPASS